MHSCVISYGNGMVLGWTGNDTTVVLASLDDIPFLYEFGLFLLLVVMFVMVVIVFIIINFISLFSISIYSNLCLLCSYLGCSIFWFLICCSSYSHVTENIDHVISIQDFTCWINMNGLVLVHGVFAIHATEVWFGSNPHGHCCMFIEYGNIVVHGVIRLHG